MLSSALKRIAATGIKRSEKTCFSYGARRSMVISADKEITEDTRKKERDAMNAKMEQILQQDDKSSQKQKLAKLLGNFFKTIINV